jgi:hypothetical protein
MTFVFGDQACDDGRTFAQADQMIPEMMSQGRLS